MVSFGRYETLGGLQAVKADYITYQLLYIPFPIEPKHFQKYCKQGQDVVRGERALVAPASSFPSNVDDLTSFPSFPSRVLVNDAPPLLHPLRSLAGAESGFSSSFDEGSAFRFEGCVVEGWNP